MKVCECCGHASPAEANVCPLCGESSWLWSERSAPAPEPDPEPVAEAAQPRRGRR